MTFTRFHLTLSALALGALCALPAAAQDEATPQELAVRQASPGVVVNSETGDYTAIELELQGCMLVQTLLTNQGYQMGGPAGGWRCSRRPSF